MTHLDSEREPIDMVAEEFADRCRRGEYPSVGDYVARYPELADEIRALLPPVAAMEQLKRLKQTGSAVPPEGNPPARLGDFRIVREVGRGGMGIVYEAVQESLGRVVALKVLPRHALLDPKKRGRFQREAQAAALLHHTNIVPVFGVGEEDGLPYYVMQLIDGKGLNELVAEWKGEATLAKQGNTMVTATTPAVGTAGPPIQAPFQVRETSSEAPARLRLPHHWIEVARIGVQAAQALDFAHKHGTLHRDVKPANLLLDRAGTVWVTDFGLAKLACQQDLTITGDVVGTLRYLAPECFEGPADARSDVYSLGLTLYELLTLQPAFRESDPARLMKQVSEQEPPRPRRVNPALPRDIETIVLKAIARDPKHRYPTVGELGEDLQRFLDDRPIRARGVTPIEHLSRWCRRNPLIAALTTAAFAFFVLAVGGYVSASAHLGEAQAAAKQAKENGARAEAAAKQAKENGARAEASSRREAKNAEDAKKATKKALENVKILLSCFDEVFDKLAARDQRAVPTRRMTPFGMMVGASSPGSEEDAALRRIILEFYDRFAERNATSPRLRQEAAKAYRRVGEIHHHLKQPGDAETAFRRATVLYEKLAAEFPRTPEYLVGLARARAKLGASLDARSKAKEAETLLRQAIAAPNVLVDRAPDRLLALAELCLARFTLADLLQRRGKEGEARTFREQARTLAKDPRLVAKLADKDTPHLANAFTELAGKLSH